MLLVVHNVTSAGRLLDVVGTTEETGKETGKDEAKVNRRNREAEGAHRTDSRTIGR